MILEIIIYLVMYSLDMFMTLVLMKKRKNAFDNYESNEYFKKIIKMYGIRRGVFVYSFSVGAQMIVINLLSMILAYRLIVGVWNFVGAIEFGLIFLAFVHVFGVLSNLLAFLKFKKVEEVKKE